MNLLVDLFVYTAPFLWFLGLLTLGYWLVRAVLLVWDRWLRFLFVRKVRVPPLRPRPRAKGTLLPFNKLELAAEIDQTPGLFPVVLRVAGQEVPLREVTNETTGSGLAGHDGRVILSDGSDAHAS